MLKSKKIRSLLFAGVLVCIALLLSDSKADAGQFEIRLATDLPPENHVVIALDDAAEEIKQKTNGNVEVIIFPGGQLGGYGMVNSLLISGDLEMTANYFGWEYDKRLNIFAYPCIIEGFDDFKVQMFPGGFMYKMMLDIQTSLGCRLLGIFNAGMIGLASIKSPGESFAEIADFSKKKDALIRIPALKLYQELLSAMGYRTTTIAYSDLYPALQSGVADGSAGGTPQINYDAFRDVIKYFVDTQFINEPMPILINQAFFDTLPAEYQKVIDEVFYNTAVRITDECEIENDSALKKMADYGITVIMPTPEEKKKLFDQVRREVLPKLRDDIGAETFDAVMNELGINTGK